MNGKYIKYHMLHNLLKLHNRYQAHLDSLFHQCKFLALIKRKIFGRIENQLHKKFIENFKSIKIYVILTLFTIMIVNARSMIWKFYLGSFFTKMKSPSITSEIDNLSTILIIRTSNLGLWQGWIRFSRIDINTVGTNSTLKFVFKFTC